MDKNYVKELHELRGMIYKGDFLESLSEDEFNAGTIKFNIPDEDKIGMTNNGEGVWGWVTPEDKEKYNNDSFDGEIKVILCNTPLNFYGLFFWGTELVIKCNGASRPVLSSRWMKEEIFTKDWYGGEEDDE